MAIQTTPAVTRHDGVPAGFTLVSSEVKRRMIMSVEGDWGTGKTDFALTAPGPIAFFKFDLNTEWTLSQWAKKKKKIYKTEYDIADPSDSNAEVKAKELVRRFTADYISCLGSTDIRTVVWDTATEIWEQVRLAEFGKLVQVPAHLYTRANNTFRGLIRAAFDSDTNLIMIHRLKDEWVGVSDPSTGKEKSKKTGRRERAGFSDLGFAVQVMVQTFFDPDAPPDESKFSVKVLKCTQNPVITHRVYEQIGDLRTNSFPCLATDVFPGTSLEEWE